VTVKIRFANPVVFVKDVQTSKRFYTEVLGLKIVQDAEVFILFEDHFSIHQADQLAFTIFGAGKGSSGELQGRDNLLLYFESPDLEGAFARVNEMAVLIHPIQRQAWGQKVFRFYDPDRHIIEIGEPMVHQF
jgi:catechol 2,3-dioxygenase-like lactoylglutathione lyase family enzyme